MLKNYGFGLSKSLANSTEMYAKVYVQDGKIITPTTTLNAFAMKVAAPFGAKLECKYVQVRAAGNGLIHAQLADVPANRPYGASWNFTDWDLTTYLTGETKPAPKPVYAPKPTFTPAPKPQTFAEFLASYEATVAPAPAPKAVVAPATLRFGTTKSLAGTGKEYTLVFVQDHKIVTPSAILDGTALLNACAYRGGDAEQKFVQVRLNGGNNIHAQLPDDSANRPYGTSFDFVDAALAAYLRG